MHAHMLLLAAVDGSFTVSPNVGLVLWTLIFLVLVAAVIGALWAVRRRRRVNRR